MSATTDETDFTVSLNLLGISFYIHYLLKLKIDDTRGTVMQWFLQKHCSPTI